MTNQPDVLLTTAQIEQWERDAAALARKIADDQTQLNELRSKLKAAEFFRPKKVAQFFEHFPDTPLPLRDAAPVAPVVEAAPDSDGDGADDNNLVGAIERIANASTKPIAKASLRGLLAAEGFAPDRLSNYFYTAIRRLKIKRRITVLDDGSLWRAPPNIMD